MAGLMTERLVVVRAEVVGHCYQCPWHDEGDGFSGGSRCGRTGQRVREINIPDTCPLRTEDPIDLRRLSDEDVANLVVACDRRLATTKIP